MYVRNTLPLAKAKPRAEAPTNDRNIEDFMG